MIKVPKNKFVTLSVYLLVYIFSYIYLAFYHQTINLIPALIHESGELDFVEVMFYSSHFLAHIPVHIVVGLVFVGTLILFGAKSKGNNKQALHLGIMLLLFLTITLVHSFWLHGKTDTLEYILQKKQGHNIYGEGGSWKLHLVSTVSVPFLIPLYVYLTLKILGKKLSWNWKGWFFIVPGFLLIPFFSFLCEGNFLPDLKYAFTNNRYLAHSVRELITFPVTYFPLFFIVFCSFEKPKLAGWFSGNKKIQLIVFISLILFIILIAYQIVLPLNEGIGNLSQKPDFTKGDSLPIFYLITSHYFEHFLDTIFFTLLCGFLFFQIRTAGTPD